MQIKLKELLENMAAEGGPPAAAANNTGGGGVVEATVEDGPSVASACPPTPRKSISSIQKAIDAASLDEESMAQADFFNPPPDPPRNTVELDTTDVEEHEEVSHRPRRRNTPPPPPPRREEEPALEGAPADAISEQPTAPAARSSGSTDAVHGEDEYEPQTFSPGMLSPLSRRPPSGIIDPPMKPPRRDSGLIDVRSMAAAYREYDGLVKKKNDDGGRGGDGETAPLPILGGEHTSPILLPQSPTSAHASKWLYALVAVLGAIVVIGSTVAITALILKRRDSGSRSFSALSPDERAALCEAEAEATRIRDDQDSIAAARRAPAPVPGTVSDSEEVTAADVAGTAAVPAAVPSSSSSSSSKSKSKEDDDHHHHSSRDRHGDDSSSGSSSTTATAAPTPPPAPTPAPSKPAASDDLASAAGSAASSSGSDPGEKCDEVECLVSGRGCCGKNPKGAGSKSDAPPPDPNLPARPERADISSGIASVQGRLQSCGDRHSVRGAVTVKISIAPSGEVKSASTSTGTADFQSCISGAIKGAKFPATQQGARVSYPVMLK